MQPDGPKYLGLAKRLEDGAIKFLAQVHFARKPVAETEPYRVVPNVTSLNDVDHEFPPAIRQSTMNRRAPVVVDDRWGMASFPTW